MKYYSFEGYYGDIPKTKNNLEKALKRIGEIDPYNIKRTSLVFNHKTVLNENEMTSKHYINRGILNVRYRLNRNLGKSGKYTNTMIRKTAYVRNNRSDNHILKVDLPKKDYIKISVAAYLTLWDCDREYCNVLLEQAKDDCIQCIKMNKQVAMQTVVPVQTDMVIKSKGRTEDVEEFIQYLRKIVGKEG